MNKTWRAPQDTPSCCNSRRDYDDDDDNDSAAKTASALSRWKAVSLPARWKAATTKKKKKASEAAAARWKADCFRSRPLKRNRYVWFQPSVGWLHSAFSSRWLVKIPLLRAHRTWIPLQPVLFFSFPFFPPLFPAPVSLKHWRAAGCFPPGGPGETQRHLFLLSNGRDVMHDARWQRRRGTNERRP